MSKPSHKYRKHSGAIYPVGRLAVNRRGFGFVVTPEGDFYIPASHMRDGMHGDTVVVRPQTGKGQNGRGQAGKGKGRSGTVVRVLERAHTTVVGTYKKNGPLGIVIPVDSRILHDIFVNAREVPGARSGDVVVARIETYPSRHNPAQGYVEEVIGRADDPAIGVEVIIREHGLSTVFSDAALEEAQAATLDIPQALAEPLRRDIRDRYIFTIDPADARDFDDAISLDWIDGSLRLGVHIADVSAYVPWDSSLDIETRGRATSVYLVDRVLPMLPEELSNDLCSLNPNEDRLAFTVDMYLTKDGAVERYELYPSVIRSSDRFTYGEVDNLLSPADGASAIPTTTCNAGNVVKPGTPFGNDVGEPALRLPGDKQDVGNVVGNALARSDEETQRVLTDFAHIASKIAQRKHARGGLDFETVEAKVRLAEDGVPLEVVLREKSTATSMIEEAMILANETVAGHMLRHEAPMIYRVHEAPDSDALESLAPILAEFDYPVKDLRDATPATFQKIIAYAEDRPEKYLINALVLRAMKRAKYVSYHDTHFGLASKAYTHFTSPIRRYPDLLVHRLLKAQLAGTLERDRGVVDMVANLDWLATHSSEMEREAEVASQESTTLKLCEYMQEFIGEEFDALISGVTSFGLFVRLENTVEGLVAAREVGDETTFDPVRHTLTVDGTGATYRLGEKIHVRLESVSVSDRRLDFSLV